MKVARYEVPGIVRDEIRPVRHGLIRVQLLRCFVSRIVLDPEEAAVCGGAPHTVPYRGPFPGTLYLATVG
jgi:hypothetical protein